MGLYINSSTASLSLSRNLYQTSVLQKNIMQKLSSGIRINSSSDDAAGLSLSQKLTSVINGNTIAKNNTQAGIAFLNTADGALGNMTNSIQRIRDLAVQAANGVYSNSERQMLQKEVSQLSNDITQTYQSTKFSSQNVFTGASGTEREAAIAAGYNDAHIITSAADFVSKITADSSGNFILANDLDLSSLGVKTNSVIANFSGNFDGNAHVISGFNINTGGAAVNNIGLFGTVSGTIKNLSIENFSVTATNSDHTGGLVGQMSAAARVTNCRASGTVNAYMNAALLVGYNNGGQVVSCNSEGTNNSSGWSAAGLVAWNDAGGLVSKSYSSATINNPGGNDDAAGMVGYNSGGSTVSECYFTGSISAYVSVYANIGGVVGCNDGATVTNCYSTGSINVTGAGSDKTGGVVGSNWAGGVVSKSYSTGTVSGHSSVGGVVGQNAGTVDNTNFYKNNMSTDAGSSINANVSPMPTGSWNTSVWDLSGSTPAFKGAMGATLTSTLYGSLSGSLQLQVGADSKDSSYVGVAQNLVLSAPNFDVTSTVNAVVSVKQAETLLGQLNSYRSGVGASVNKLQGVLGAIDNRVINLSSSKSTIFDADVAKESSSFVKSQISQQSATTMLQQVKGLDSSLVMSLLSNL